MNSALFFVLCGQTGTGGVTAPSIQSRLSLSDYHLCGPVKKMLGWQKFASDTEVQSTARQWLRQQPALFFLHQAFRNLLTDGMYLNEFGRFVEKCDTNV